MTPHTASEQSTADSNVSLMRAIFDDLAAGDSMRFVEALDDEATLTVTGDYSWSRTFTGKESMLRDLYGYVGSCTEGRGSWTATNIIGGGDWVVVEARGDLVANDGTPYRNDYCLLYRIAGGRIVEIREYQDSLLCESVLGPYPRESDATSAIV